jgi:hypothetical protein
VRDSEQGAGLEVWGLGFGVWGLGSGVWGVRVILYTCLLLYHKSENCEQRSVSKQGSLCDYNPFRGRYAPWTLGGVAADPGLRPWANVNCTFGAPEWKLVSCKKVAPPARSWTRRLFSVDGCPYGVAALLGIGRDGPLTQACEASLRWSSALLSNLG